MDITFEQAAEKIKGAEIKNDTDKLDVYKYYKQATVGDVNIPRPGMFSPKDRAKWDAWNSVKGLATADAKAKYVEVCKKFIK
jgi:diazepam-binding inhibitor (GABA receptor modulating acyl-CoA-binding protein)